ncbi:MAG: type IV secretory system conjugative DNA transfer family protein, partial [Selenomonadaceae bacterium]|nr:type IV secretory system conjugative DNA transfer family protein [Selenomonadaceae bacterium]
MDEEREYRQKVMKIGSVSIGICLLLAYWYATQSVAAECEYNPALGTCLSFGDIHIYQPFQYYFWQQDARISEAIPEVLGGYAFYPYLAVVVGGGFTYLCTQGLKKETSHGSASFASKKEIDETGLGMYEDKVQKEKRKILGIIPYTKKVRKPKTSGVVVGVNPYTHKLMLHDGVEHMLLMAPTRSGKGVNTIIPTGLVWRHSIFFFDVKGELWQATSGFRQKVLGQKVMKFAPLCGDGSSARWNPLAEINFQTPEELGDVSTIVGIMVKPDGEKQGGGDPFWDNSASALLSGVIMHLMYKHNKEKLRLPCPTDIMSFLSSPDKTTKELFTAMRDYPHISPEEFLELPDEQGKPRINPLKLVYGEYVVNLKPFSDALGKTVHNLEEIRLAILESKEKICWDAPPPKDDNGFGDEEENAPPPPPFYMLLVHPKVAECASNMLNGAEQTRASIMQTAQTALALYQNPVVQKNTEVSDFCIRDLLSPKDTVSLYLCMQTNEVQTLKP